MVSGSGAILGMPCFMLLSFNEGAHLQGVVVNLQSKFNTQHRVVTTRVSPGGQIVPRAIEVNHISPGPVSLRCYNYLMQEVRLQMPCCLTLEFEI
tara:strand:- start:425 stop:709 length:285 start_codon:yes stop_codon:yes gene_type:complete